MSPALLTETDLTQALTGLPGWTGSVAGISRTITAPSFIDGIDLVRRVAAAAESADHHPDIDIRWRKVTFTLSTHVSGGVTALDIALAEQIDRLAE
ncbi:4a-hydroxytetrahydrobiopterin dehydratase [Nocardia panacis]|uniref:Putative pterin-4-alpha-carbinolamine dehydratase n=1 Tax=Nocardia panacis TaxID=2340916 RepID=A0A3A4L1N6_9NOCA|nr:4a-hydroxytetrahydrobiopterin dehydratase [Nocardia panacis]RJO75885.1 4a-hydroxytetrahydrobiopterin dehydratase [Nocardia panacis]